MLRGPLAKRGYMRWWHSFRGVSVDTGEARTFFVEYLIMNPALGGSKAILTRHPLHKKQGEKPSYVMIKAGVFPDGSDEGLQLHAYYPTSALKTAFKPLYMQVGDCVYSENRIAGYVDVSSQEASHPFLMSDAGTMEWDLEVCKTLAFHTGPICGPLACAMNALDTFWHGEGIRTAYSGSVILNGTAYEVTPSECYGYADKHWGRSYNRPWLQLASCDLVSERTGKPLNYSALAVEGCCPRLLFLPLKPKLMLQFTYTGEDYEFSFARPRLFSRSRWKVKSTNKRFIWHVKAQNKKALVKISVNCLKDDMLPLMYETPDGTVRRRPLYAGGSGIGTIELYRIVPEGRQLVDTVTIRNTFCAFQTVE